MHSKGKVNVKTSDRYHFVLIPSGPAGGSEEDSDRLSYRGPRGGQCLVVYRYVPRRTVVGSPTSVP